MKKKWRLHIRLFVLTTLSLAGCADLAFGPEAPSPDNALWMLRLAPRGITMAVGAEQAITPTALNIVNTQIPISDSSPVFYISSDDSRVKVTPQGVIQAVQATISTTTLGPSPVRIIGSWYYNGVTKADTVYVAVTPTGPAEPVASISIQPGEYPLDSTWGGAFGSKQISVTARTASGRVVSQDSVYAYLWTSTPFLSTGRERMNPETRMLSLGGKTGPLWIYSEAMVYGQILRDSVQYTITHPVSFITVYLSPDPFMPGRVKVSPSDITIGVCGSIIFVNSLSDPVNIAFSDSATNGVCGVGGALGDIENLEPGRTATRKFLWTGAHSWTAERTDGVPFSTGVSGTIRVKPHTDYEYD